MKTLKKFLIISIFLISTIFFIDNVSAADVVHVNVDYDSTYVSEIVDKLSEEIAIAKELANYYKNSQKYSIVLTYNRVNFILYESATTTKLRSMFYGGANNKLEGKPDNTSYKYISIVDNTTYDLNSLINNLDNSSYKKSDYWSVFNSSRYIYGNSIPKETFNLYQYSSENYSSFSSGVGIIYETNLDNIEIISTEDFLPISFNGGDILYEGDSFLTYTQVMNTTPTISITKESENTVEIGETEYITDVTLNIEFSNIDNDRYFYLYKYGKDSEWAQIVLTQSNSISKTFSTNDTLYVQILDQTTQEYIIGATYLIDNINYDGKPYITFGLIDSENENICITESGKHICENLIIDSHITNFEQYSFYVFNNTTNESKRSFESKVSYFVYENSTIEARIVDNYKNEVIDKKFYNINTISLDSSMGQHITDDCYFAQFGTNYLCNFYFYNYDPNSYKYYIGTNTSNFVELLNNNTGTWLNNKLINFYLVQDNLAKLHEFSINENTTFYFKIVDKETDEIIYRKTFTIPYDKKLEESNKTNLFNIFKTYINENENLKNIIDKVWTSISSSAIYEYILILIIGTLIVLIIKSANR